MIRNFSVLALAVVIGTAAVSAQVKHVDLKDAKGASVEGTFLYANAAIKKAPRGQRLATIADEIFEFLLPEGFEAAALVYSSVEVFEEVRIPFEIQEALR